jgi:HSP20 family protein
MFVQFRRSPVQHSLWNEIANFEREVDSAFNRSASSDPLPARKYSPAIDVVENGNETVLMAELPGVSKEDVKISLENDILTISGVRKSNSLPEKASWLRNEIRTGEFVRSVKLPKGIDAGKISAAITNGLLRVVLPKAEEVKPREIRIN